MADEAAAVGTLGHRRTLCPGNRLGRQAPSLLCTHRAGQGAARDREASWLRSVFSDKEAVAGPMVSEESQAWVC